MSLAIYKISEYSNSFARSSWLSSWQTRCMEDDHYLVLLVCNLSGEGLSASCLTSPVSHDLDANLIGRPSFGSARSILNSFWHNTPLFRLSVTFPHSFECVLTLSSIKHRLSLNIWPQKPTRSLLLAYLFYYMCKYIVHSPRLTSHYHHNSLQIHVFCIYISHI